MRKMKSAYVAEFTVSLQRYSAWMRTSRIGGCFSEGSVQPCSELRTQWFAQTISLISEQPRAH